VWNRKLDGEDEAKDSGILFPTRIGVPGCKAFSASERSGNIRGGIVE
jgi:hypothetical protein